MSSIDKTFNLTKRNISYLNKTFDQYVESLRTFSKYYFPNTHQDFGPETVGRMFIEQAAYVGEVLSFYTDKQLQESLLSSANERKNIVNAAISRGYRIKPSNASQVKLEVYQVVPSVEESGEFIPDYRYIQNILEGMSAQTSDGISFISDDYINFRSNTENSPLEIIKFESDQNGNPQSFLLKKIANAYSGQRKTITITVSDPQPYYTIQLEETNVLKIESIIDADGQVWYEVDNFAQSLIPVSEINSPSRDEFLSNDINTTPYILKYIKADKKFISYSDHENRTFIKFGSGEKILKTSNFPNQNLVSKEFLNNIENYNKEFSYGKTPSNTTLSITYVYGGGTNSNVSSNTIVNVGTINFEDDIQDYNLDEARIIQYVRNSVRVSNSEPASGGSGSETDDQIRENSISLYSSQKRMVTSEDYEVSCYSLPPRYGKVSKAFALRDPEKTRNINLYILSSDENGRLIKSNDSLKVNLKRYMEPYKIISDIVNILDAEIINIGVEFKIVVQNGYSKRQVLNNCLEIAKSFLSNENIQIGQEIDISRLQLEIGKTEGVSSVLYIKIKNLNKTNGDYSEVEYDIDSAKRDNVIYPSSDPSIFEVKYPNRDIQGTYI